METYLHGLSSSTIPFPPWGIVTIWLVIFASAPVVSRKAAALSATQSFVIIGGPVGLVKEQSFKLLIGQVLFSAAIFTFASILGGPVFVFFAGGWVVTTLVSIPLNLRSVLFLRALSKPGAAQGSVTLSNYLAVKDLAFQLFGVAAFCLLLGVILAHLALLGGAFFLTATSLGYLKKTKPDVSLQPPPA